ncbi:MAG: SRPBCC domain-containing protein [Terriglobales bacterium]
MQGTPTAGIDTLVVERYVRAKPREVFADLTVPDRLLRWWGDRSKWWLTSAEVDLRPGGRFWVLWKNTKGETDGMGGHFEAIEPNRGFVLSFMGSHAKSYIDDVAIQLDPENSGTKVMLRHSGLAGRPEQYTDYQQGWTLILGWLARQY